VPDGQVYRPVRVRGGSWDTISVGGEGACGLKAGAAWCWGTDLDGGLGTGSVSMGCGGTSSTNSGCAFEPVRSAEGFTFRRISAGGTLQRPFRPFNRVTCGQTADGAAHCWGSDAWGTLGDGAPYPAANPSPRPVAGNHVFTSVSVGYHHSCAVDREGAAWCWGQENAGELGHAQTIGDIAPTPAAVEGGLRFRRLDTGFNHTCGITAEGGQLWCWGSNNQGQLGTAQAVGSCGDGFSCSEVPVRVASGETFVQVTAGLSHTCALTADGRVFCWGTASLAGRGATPGDAADCGGTPCYRTPRPVQGSERYVQVEAGREFTCALSRASRNALCWGDYRGVAQGIGAPVYVPTPIVSPSASAE
jgi:alpha-tubulin suppressor-like RCC1 family protein